MLERRRRSEELPITFVRVDRAPVRDVRERRERLRAQIGELVRFGDGPAVERDGRHQREERGKKSTRAPRPKRAEIDAPRALVLGEKERRDQETRKHEEQIDAEKSAGEHALRMKKQDAEQRQTTEPVERGNVRESIFKVPGRVMRSIPRATLDRASDPL